MEVSNTILNIAPVLSFLQGMMIILGGFTLFGIMIFLVFGNRNLNILAKMNSKILDKYPMVTEQFLKLTLKQQTIENNQEIHELNVRLAKLEKKLK